MNGLKIKIAIVCAIAAAALTMLYFQQQTLKQLRQENEALKQQAAAQTAATQEQQARATQEAASAGGSAEEQTRELARLRNEVSQLRKMTNDMGKSRLQMQAQNQRLQSEAEASKNTAAAAQAESQRAQNMNACINNLRLFDAAKQQWALENRKQATDTPTMADLQPYIGRGPNGAMPTCPDGGVYTLGAVNEKPTCSIPGHVLP